MDGMMFMGAVGFLPSAVVAVLGVAAVVVAVVVDERRFQETRNETRRYQRLKKHRERERTLVDRQNQLRALIAGAHSEISTHYSTRRNLSSKTDRHWIAGQKITKLKPRVQELEGELKLVADEFDKLKDEAGGDEPYESVSPAPLLVAPIFVAMLLPMKIVPMIVSMDGQGGFWDLYRSWLEPCLAMMVGYVLSLLVHVLRGHRVRRFGDAVAAMVVLPLAPAAGWIGIMIVVLVLGLPLIILDIFLPITTEAVLDFVFRILAVCAYFAVWVMLFEVLAVHDTERI